MFESTIRNNIMSYAISLLMMPKSTTLALMAANENMRVLLIANKNKHNAVNRSHHSHWNFLL